MSMYEIISKLAALTEAKEETTTSKGGTKTVDTEKKTTTHKGKYGTEFDPAEEDADGKKIKKPAKPDDEKRARGRPKKEGDGPKPDFSAFGAKGKDVKLKPWDKAKTVKHSLKEWVDQLDAMLEDRTDEGLDMGGASRMVQQLAAQGKSVKEIAILVAKETGNNPNDIFAWVQSNMPMQEEVEFKPMQPKPGQQVAVSDGKPVASVSQQGANALKQLSDKGDVDFGAADEVKETKNHMGETEYNTYFGWKVASRKAGAKTFTGDRDIDQGLDASGKAVSEWDGEKGSIFNPAEAELDEFARHTPPQSGSPDSRQQRNQEWARNPVAEAKKAKPDFLDVDKDKNKKEPFKKAVKDADKKPVEEAKSAKPDFLDVDKDKNKKEPFKKAVKDAKKVEEGKDEGKPGKNFQKIAKSAGEKYGSKEAGERVAGAVRNKLKAKGKLEESMLTESLDTLTHIISTFRHEVKNFVAGQDMDDDLYHALYDYYSEMGDIPYGVAKARTGDPYEWVSDRFGSDIEGHEIPGLDEDVRAEMIPAVTRRQAGAAPLSLAQVRAPRADSISDPTNLRVANKPADPFGLNQHHDVQFESWDKALDTILNEGMNITTNTGLDGPDSVTISATDQDADELLNIVRSAGLGVFGGGEGNSAMSQPQEPGIVSDQPNAEIDVVDDHDGMMSMIKKMTGQGDQPEKQDECGMTMDEDGAPEGDSDSAMEKLENVHAAWEAAGESDEEGPQGNRGPNTDGEEELDEFKRHPRNQERPAPEEKEKEEVEESYANSADKSFLADIEFMTKGLSGGLNGKKKTQSVGNPVTIADTPMKESTDLLADWKRLAGF